MTDTDPEEERRRRQAPRYGEYATPEEVAALRGPDAEPLVPAPAPARLQPPTGEPLRGEPPAGRPRTVAGDSVATIALLVFGALNVTGSVGAYLDLRATVAAQLSALGVDDVDVPASVQPWGYLLIAVEVVVLLGAAALSLHRLRRGRVAFWVPLVGALVAGIVDAVILLAVLAGSGVLAALQNQS